MFDKRVYMFHHSQYQVSIKNLVLLITLYIYYDIIILIAHSYKYSFVNCNFFIIIYRMEVICKVFNTNLNLENFSLYQTKIGFFINLF